MKFFEKYNNIDEKEKLFIELAHLDELEIKFDFIKYEDELFYFYKEKCLFDQDKKCKDFWIKNDDIWSVFSSNFGLNHQEIKDVMSSKIDKHFKLNKYTTLIRYNYSSCLIEKHFKLNEYTTNNDILNA